jgi:hypothetical protein
MAYDRALSVEKPILDVSEQFTQDEVLLAARFLVGEDKTLQTIELSVYANSEYLGLDPVLCTGVMEFLDTLGLEATKKRVEKYIIKLITDDTRFHGVYKQDVTFVVCHLKRRLDKTDLYWQLIEVIALDLEKYSNVIEKHCELFREHNVFEQICRAFVRS